MAYTPLSLTQPNSSQTGSQFATSALADILALLDMVGAGQMQGFAFSQSGGTAEEPTTLLFKNGTRWLRAVLTWTSGNVTGITYSLSTNSGSTYDTIGSASVLTYDGSGNLTATTNFGGMIAKVWEWIGKVKALRTLFNSHAAGAGTAVHSLGTMSTQASTAVNIDGGSIDGTTLGAATPAAASVVGIDETAVNLGNLTGTKAIDWSAGGLQYGTVTGNVTLSWTNLPAAGRAKGLTLELTNPGAFTVTWPAGVKWPGGVAPTNTASGVDILEFLCRDGSTVRGAQAQKASA